MALPSVLYRILATFPILCVVTLLSASIRPGWNCSVYFVFRLGRKLERKPVCNVFFFLQILKPISASYYLFDFDAGLGCPLE